MTVPGLRHHRLTRLSHSQAGCQIHRHLPCISPDYRLAGVFHVKSWQLQDLGHHQTFVVQVWSPSLETPLPLECPVWKPSYLRSAGECPAQATWDTAEPAATWTQRRRHLIHTRSCFPSYSDDRQLRQGFSRSWFASHSLLSAHSAQCLTVVFNRTMRTCV